MTQTSTEQDGTEAALVVLRAMVAIADSTVERNTEQLTLTQFRALRVVVDRTPVTMGGVARELAMNPSSVTRACDRLVALNLASRKSKTGERSLPARKAGIRFVLVRVKRRRST